MLHIRLFSIQGTDDAYETHVAFVLVAMRISFDSYMIKMSSPLYIKAGIFIVS